MSSITMANEPIALKNNFTIEEVQWVKNAGNSTVEGRAYIKLLNGEYKGCEGFHLELLPVGRYATERILKTYNSTSSGQILLSDKPPKFIPDVKEYHEYVLKTQCGVGDTFKFTHVPSGEYYLIAFIIWGEVANQQGGGVMQRISLEKNQNLQVSLGSEPL